MIVHLVTDRRRLSSAPSWFDVRRCLLNQLDEAVAAGVDHVHVRERDLDAGDLAALVADMVDRVRGSVTRIVVNDRLDVALASGAHGVHLRGDSIPAALVRRLAPDGFLIGCSVHCLEDAIAASGADYLIAGTVWRTVSKPDDHSLLGVQGLASIVRASAVPVLAIGGLTMPRVRDVAEAGAAGIAAIGLFLSAEGATCRSAPLEEIVRNLRTGFDTP